MLSQGLQGTEGQVLPINWVFLAVVGIFDRAWVNDLG